MLINVVVDRKIVSCWQFSGDDNNMHGRVEHMASDWISVKIAKALTDYNIFIKASRLERCVSKLLRQLLTRSSTATLRDFQTNSQTAMTHATPIPPISTTNTPPTFANPSSFAVDDDFEVSSCVIKNVIQRKRYY